ncbi:hypothetical protein [uncultured Marinobacter sp.]|uniref:hypothetical protein n=1 Tax=uncultured Marinobacter sp. TaxID=187379 RepID=UPI002637A0A5|nr:hypothetical protein [uncultured Marinobacter sp.]
MACSSHLPPARSPYPLRFLFGILLSFLAGTAQCLAEVRNAAYQPPPLKEYILWYRNYDSPAIRALLELALKKTPEYGDFRIIRSEEMGQGRVLRELAHGRTTLIDIANVASSSERESQMLAIPIPIDGGLLGFRVCVVLPQALPLFEGVRSVEDLRDRGIRIGQGLHWPDTDILKVNDIPVVTHTRYEILFRMLRNDRFDCFARGVSEVMYDLAIENDPDLVIEPSIMLAYPMPSYFFTSPYDYLTAHRVQLGMERAIRDGSFAQFLATYYGKAIETLALDSRTVIVLRNPFLSEESRTVGRQTLDNLQRRLQLLSQ